MANLKEQPTDIETPSTDTQQEARPNRDAYSKMWAEDNDDIDFEDKENRYARAIEDRNELRERRKADAALGGLFDKHDWLQQLYSELKDSPDIDIFEWLEGFCNENDLTIQEVLDNPDAKKRLAKKLADRNKSIAEKEAKDKQIEENMVKSYKVLAGMFPDKPKEDIDGIWTSFWEIVDSAENGVVSEKTLRDFTNSLTYEDDMNNARQQAAMQARNEKITNKVRKPSEDVKGLPPSLSQGAGAPTQREMPKKKSFAKSFFEDID